MRAFLAMLGLAFVAGFAAAGTGSVATASASQLDLNPFIGDAGSRTTLLALNRPIRHRRPHGERGYGYRPTEYFATLGFGAFDPSNQPGSGLYLSGSAGSVLSDQLDVGLQLSWYHRSTGGEEFIREGDLPDGDRKSVV